MKSLRVLSIALLAAAALPAGASAASPQDEVTQAYAAWDAALNSGDAKVVAAFYEPDATILPPTHDVIKGPAGAEKFFGAVLASGLTSHKLELIEVEGDGSGDLIVAAAKWSAKGKNADGSPATFGGIATHVFEKQADRSLKLKLHTFN